MGAAQSTQHSTPNDVKNNLLWCLDESVHWEEEASVARLLLAEAASTRPGQTSVGSVTRLDDASRNRAINLLKQTSELTFVRIDGLLKNTSNKLKDFPASHPARATLASRTFAAAATENLASNIDSLVVNNPALFSEAEASTIPGTKNSSISNPSNIPSTSNISNTSRNSQVSTAANINQQNLNTTNTSFSGKSEATIIEGPVDLKGTGTASPPALNATDINAGQAFTPEKIAQQERVELAAKFLFIYSLLTKTTACAQQAYKLNTRFNSLRKALKPKRAEKLDDTTLSSLRESQQRADQALRLSLANFDRAKSALVWLRKDYELTYASHRCSELLSSAHKLRDTMTYDDDNRANRAIESRLATGPNSTGPTNSSADDKFYDPKVESRYSDEIADLDRLISALQSRHVNLEHAIQQNERDSLNVAFDYLDANNRGEITHEQCPQLGDRLWRALDTRAHGKITRANMIKGMDNLSKSIDNLHTQIMEIERGDPKTRHRSDLSHMKQEFREQRKTLRQLNQYFYQYFVEAVFSDMDSSVRQETVDITNLQNDIQLLEKALTSAVDPLETSQSRSSNITDTSIAGSGATNILAQHKQVSARSIEAHQQELVKEDRIVAGPTFVKAEAGVPGTNMDKELHSYGTETRTGVLGNQPADSTIGTVHNSNTASAQREPINRGM